MFQIHFMFIVFIFSNHPSRPGNKCFSRGRVITSQFDLRERCVQSDRASSLGASPKMQSPGCVTWHAKNNGTEPDLSRWFMSEQFSSSSVDDHVEDPPKKKAMRDLNEKEQQKSGPWGKFNWKIRTFGDDASLALLSCRVIPWTGTRKTIINFRPCLVNQVLSREREEVLPWTYLKCLSKAGVELWLRNVFWDVKLRPFLRFCIRLNIIGLYK